MDRCFQRRSWAKWIFSPQFICWWNGIFLLLLCKKDAKCIFTLVQSPTRIDRPMNVKCFACFSNNNFTNNYEGKWLLLLKTNFNWLGMHGESLKWCNRSIRHMQLGLVNSLWDKCTFQAMPNFITKLTENEGYLTMHGEI